MKSYNGAIHIKEAAQSTLVFGIIFIVPLICYAQPAAPSGVRNKSSRPELIIQQGYSGVTRSLAFSPDEKRLAIADGATVKVWDLLSGDMTRSIPIGNGEGLKLAFSPNGKMLGVMTDSDRVWLYDAQSFTLLRGIVPGRDAESLAFSADSSTIAMCSRENGTTFWSCYTGKWLRTIRTHQAHTAFVRFSVIGSLIAIVGGGRESGFTSAEIWDARTGALVTTIHTSRDICTASFSPAGNVLALGTDTNLFTGIAAELWDIKTNRRLGSLSEPGPEYKEEIGAGINDFSAIAYTPHEKRLVVSDGSGVVRVWDPSTADLLLTMGERGSTSHSAISRCGHLAALGAFDGEVRIYDTETGKLRRVIGGRRHDMNEFAICNNGNTIVVPVFKHLNEGYSSDLYFWDLRSGVCTGTMPLGRTGVGSFSITPDERLAAIADATSRTSVWDVQNRRFVTTVDSSASKDRDVNSVAISPDGRNVAICGTRERTNSREDRRLPKPPSYKSDRVGFLEIWNVARCVKEREIMGPSGDVDALAFSNDGKTLFCKGSARNMIEWKWKTGTFVTHPTKEWGGLVGGILSAICTSRDSRVVAVRSDTAAVYVWDSDTQRRPVTLHEYGDNAIAVSPDGRQVAIGTLDGSINLWNIRNRKLSAKLGGDGTKMQSIAFTPDGKSITGLDSERGIRIWDTRTGCLKATMTLLGTTADHADEWISFTPDGHYICSGKAEKYIRWRVNGKLISAGRYTPAMRQPALLQLEARSPSRILTSARSPRQPSVQAKKRRTKQQALEKGAQQIRRIIAEQSGATYL